MKKVFFVIITYFIFIVSALGQISVQATIDSTQIVIGDQTNINFEIIQNKKDKVQFPVLKDSIVSGLEIVELTKPDTIELNEQQYKIKAKVVVTSFDSALYYIPPQEFISNNDTFKTNELSLMVYTIDVDTTKGIYDIKPIYNAKINWKLVMTIVLISLLSIALLVFLFIYIKKRFFSEKEQRELKKEQNIPPHIKALSELDRIKQEKIWQEGRIKEFYTEVSIVIREYIENSYDIAALEQTSDEILREINISDLRDDKLIDRLKQILQLSDLVKFAKWVPDTKDHDTTLSNAYVFVNETVSSDVEDQNNNKEE